jgi:hypothetical protein
VLNAMKAGIAASRVDYILVSMAEGSDEPLADTIGRAGHDTVHDRFCIQLMVNAVHGLYDDGTRAIRPREVAATAG